MRLRITTAAGVGPASNPITATPTLWPIASRAGGTGEAAALGVSAFANGGAIVTGHFNGTITFGTTTLSSAGGIALFVAKLSTNSAW